MKVVRIWRVCDIKGPTIVAIEAGYARPVHSRHSRGEGRQEPCGLIAISGKGAENIVQGGHIEHLESEGIVGDDLLVAIG